MRILGIVGSNRKDGNSYLLVREMLKDVSQHETKIIQIAELNIKPCELCFERCAPQPFECIIDDDFQKLSKEMTLAHIQPLTITAGLRLKLQI